MKARSRNALGLLCAVVLFDVAAQQGDAEEPRRSRMVGAGDSLAIESSDGQLMSIAQSAGCSSPLSRAGVTQVDCAAVDDGVVYYFHEATRAMIEACDKRVADPKRCPPPQWPLEVPGCDGAVPQSIAGTWLFHSLPRAGGFFPIAAGWTMTLRGGSVLFDFNGMARVVRSYTAAELGDGRYAVEITDSRAATTAIRVELAQCGFIVEGVDECDAFCRNVAAEFGIPGLPDQLEPLFPARVFFRAMTAGG